jgi:hypothetical protein
MMKTTVKVTFVHYEWDNYQGSSGRVFKREELIELPGNIPISELRSECNNWLKEKGFINDWGLPVFHDRGIINITLF